MKAEIKEWEVHSPRCGEIIYSTETKCTNCENCHYQMIRDYDLVLEKYTYE
jgi:transposase